MCPRLSAPLPRNDQWKATTPDLEGHRKRLREAFGNTLSDEFVDVALRHENLVMSAKNPVGDKATAVVADDWKETLKRVGGSQSDDNAIRSRAVGCRRWPARAAEMPMRLTVG
jgi:hypothetical protein